MKSARFEYRRPAGLPDALQALDTNESNIKILGGSQSLGPMLNMRLARPSALVDVSGLEALREVSVLSPGHHDSVRIGAAVTHAQIEDGVFDALADHPMREVARDIAYRAVRNRGTIGGSLVHADPAADWVVVLNAMDATIHLSSAQGHRDVRVQDFYLGAYATVLEPNEVLTGISLPAMPPEDRKSVV